MDTKFTYFTTLHSKISKKAIEKEEYGNNKILIICSLVFIFVIH